MNIYNGTLTIFILFLVSCTKYEQDPSYATFENNISSPQLFCGNDKVSIDDIANVVDREYPLSKAAKVEITPIVGAKSDTLLYIVNNKDKGGWKIYSSDKRTPAVIAEGETGCFSLEEGSPALAYWMKHVEEDMERIKNAPDAELAFSEEDIVLNRSFWTGEYPNKAISKVAPNYPLGHWEETVYSQTVEYDHVDHLVPQWDQAYPYNECCPYLVSTPNSKAYAGCVAIAGSQVLYYLHNKIGVPESMYSTGTCTGNVDVFTRSFNNPSSSVWAAMNFNYQYYASSMLPEAIMISYVGMMVNMHYCDNTFGQYSWALPGNLKSDLFEYYGINCSKGNYDENTVKNSLLNEMPVIVSASDMAVPLDGDIHTFVIDGYRRTRTQYTHHHYYVIDVPPTGPYEMPREYTTYTYSSPQLTSIKINWGWSSQWTSGTNDGWYALTSGWTVTNGGTYDYDHNLSMIYGFTTD